MKREKLKRLLGLVVNIDAENSTEYKMEVERRRKRDFARDKRCQILKYNLPAQAQKTENGIAHL